MVTAIQKRPEGVTAIADRVDVLEGVSFTELVQMGDQLVRTGFLPDHIRNGVQFTAIVMAGRELGMAPMRALRSLQLVKGKVMEDAASQLSRFKLAGGRATFEVLDETRAVLKLTHPNGDTHTETWTLEDAKRAESGKGGMLAKFPKAMLRSRVITAGLKSLGWDGAVGNYDPAELVDDDAAPARAVQAAPVAKAPEPEVVDAPVFDMEPAYKLAQLIVEAGDKAELQYALDHVVEVVDDSKQGKAVRLALDALIEERTAQLDGEEWQPTDAKKAAAGRMKQRLAERAQPTQ
jgi:hypothetical protein